MRRFALYRSVCTPRRLLRSLLWVHRRPPVQEAPDTQGTVELVMLERKGSGAHRARASLRPSSACATRSTRTIATRTNVNPPRPTRRCRYLRPRHCGTTEAPRTGKYTRAPPVSTPPVQHTVRRPRINLGGTDSETNALAIGDHVVSARVDAKFHNKEPNYPLEAARRAPAGIGHTTDPRFSEWAHQRCRRGGEFRY